MSLSAIMCEFINLSFIIILIYLKRKENTITRGCSQRNKAINTTETVNRKFDRAILFLSYT